MSKGRVAARAWAAAGWIGIAAGSVGCWPRPVPSASKATVSKARLVVLTDIEADPDDTQSLIRLLLYSNQIDIEGLIATTSVHQKGRVAPESIRSLVGAYGQVQARLLEHEAGFPPAAALLAVVSQGLAAYGMNGVGEGKDSPGSDRVVQILEENDERPLWVSIWGGANTLAQALHKIRKTRSAAEAARLVSKLRVYAISDQDDSGVWIRTEFPELFYIVSPGGYAAATWGGMMAAQTGFDSTEVSNRWIAANVQQGHGPLGARYPDVAYGMEGDTPSFLSLIPNGLNVPEQPSWGGWGGRYELYRPELANTDPSGFTGGVPVTPEPRPIWTNAVDTYRPYEAAEYGRPVQPSAQSFTGYQTTIWRWRKEFQNDFAARVAWTSRPFAEANHPPAPKLGHSDRLTVRSGDGFGLSAAGTTDPDGDSLSYLWFHYPEASSYRSPVRIDSAENLRDVYVKAPVVTRPETLHFVLKVTDKGTPPLTRYARVIVNVVP
jgi:Protein of unknown function (DUF1593)